ncbi:dihydroneopterin aldolase [Sphingomonas sp. BIUV-7]|uniref:dihydroneopterin aldolase n=1 Tax=Sphingomonas natans TaxID=3063330 RepID=A0ABT8YAR9_9SPHN|nr:dihydroneopterin aldolase [Sphingomonas sp. BIUV-7]MDO6414809.1 dihydroneopterin aldolase [Sphingomonas sp. BIUV-7]
MTHESAAAAAIPAQLAPRSFRIFLDGLDLPVDIGFHDFEVGAPQRLRVTVELWVDEAHFPSSDRVAEAWNYDLLRTGILRLAEGRRFNLQETFAREIYALIAARPGVTAIRVVTSKPDVYPDCAGVGVEISST